MHTTDNTSKSSLDLDLCGVTWRNNDGKLYYFDTLEVQLKWDDPGSGSYTPLEEESEYLGEEDSSKRQDDETISSVVDDRSDDRERKRARLND